MIPDLPDKIEMTRSQLQDHLKTKTKYGEVINEIKESELRSFGIIFTSYSELEPDYVEHYKKEIRLRAKELSLMVKRSVEEGGSSYSDLNALIEEIKARVFQKE
ncbi:hypothetical protein Acr_04g0007910 [Actinidia rufa]|uniref:Uncharacterized protein n=1 Tax=Actinidia rufa TaxID=165716 RepID=A0A7J0EHT7_9ERIC|nr:hypothetical protein Acr_04g0007910 [Actinidia rufa]